ncbi:uncharacterized protein LOC121992812 isoform X2 [Zingiber officinale]|uniref:uncharacterized protein LOC121992812 isoform X2 n=1 Tax=Zingiber officinale TaxID=94328 RepID=UPI001C4BD519|nr:uncharacterized protein LOC121992812 isoform X2 [Zingiber officinale]
MGDLQAWPALSDEGSLEEVGQPMQPHPPPVNPDPSAISAENRQVAEKATQDVLRCIQPTVVSEHRRKGVVEYVQKLLKRCIGIEVFPFGSVPLRTYLPDGDIDLTAIGYPNSENALANDVWSVLDGEEQCKDAEFEVKLVKCVVENIIVDISFNQIGGLSTLCFLEKVDQKIGKDHLFKRSIILIKAWCYYESRILGAYHGLISTYALETLVLYVFHLFHNSLDGPLAVLYKFLDFYSKFEWDKYCISLQGLISVSSLPEPLVADMPDFNGSNLLFSKEFIEECVEMFSAPLRLSETSPKVFSKKHLNIVDPLKQNNNLGRSVSKGNFYRIQSAFAYGAQKLCRILKLSMENIASEVGTFFASILERHGTGERPDVLSSSPNSLDSEFIQDTGVHCTSSRYLSLGGLPIKDCNAILNRELLNIKMSDLDKSDFQSRSDSVKGLDSEARECASLDALSLTAIESSIASPSHGDSSSGDAYYSPPLFFHAENDSKNAILDTLNLRDTANKEVSLSRSTASNEEINYEIALLLGTSKLWFKTNSMSESTHSIHGSSRASWNSNLSGQSIHADCSNEDDGNTRNSKFSKLSDLVGEFDVHYQNLLYALGSQGQEYLMNQYIMPVHRSIYMHMATNNLVPASPYSPTAYSMNQYLIPGVYCAKDVQKRGTGTYFPDPNSRSYREKQSPRKRKNPTSSRSRSRNNSRWDGQQDRNLLDEENDEPLSQVYSANDHGILEFGSLGPVPLRVFSKQSSRHEVTSPNRSNATATAVPTNQRSSSNIQFGRLTKPYQLKDEGDFPPLSG